VAANLLDGEGTFEGGEFRVDVREGNGYLLARAKLEVSDAHDCCLVVGEDPDVAFLSKSFAALQGIFGSLLDAV